MPREHSYTVTYVPDGKYVEAVLHGEFDLDAVRELRAKILAELHTTGSNRTFYDLRDTNIAKITFEAITAADVTQYPQVGDKIVFIYQTPFQLAVARQITSFAFSQPGPDRLLFTADENEAKTWLTADISS